MLTHEDVARLSTTEQLDRLAAGPETVGGAIAGQSGTVLGRRPDAKNWAPTEVVCHLRDTEEFFMLRFQAVLAMDEPRLLAADPDRWADERQYQRNEAAAALGAFRARRTESLALLRGLTPVQWERGGIHPTRGRMTIADLVRLMVWHDDNHVEQIRRGLRGEA
jgi:hypothetical protein